MSATYSTPGGAINGLFKKVYSSLEDLTPGKPYLGLELAPFETRKKAGASIEMAVNVSYENGVTLASYDGAAITFKDVQSGVVKQATIYPYEMYVSSGISISAISRSVSEGEQAFKAATKDRVAANIKSHYKWAEQLFWYGQDTYGLGRVCYETMTWRGATLTAGSGTVNGITFTNGVNTSSKHVLIDPYDLASGWIIGSEGLELSQWDGSTETDLGTIAEVNLKYGYIKVTGTPVVASSTTSHWLVLKNQHLAYDTFGAKKILTATTVHGLSTTTYGLWAGTQYTVPLDGSSAKQKLTFARLIDAVAEACDRGLDGDLEVVTSYATWADMCADQSALRVYDSKYEPNMAVNGFEGLKFHFVNGQIRVRPSRFVRRSDTFCMARGDWSRVGSSDVTLRVPGTSDGDMVIPPIAQNVFIYRSFSDMSPVCKSPARSIYIYNIDPDAST